MSNKHPSSTEIIKQQQEQKVKNFTSDYYTLCSKYKLQIVQSPLSIADYIPPEEVKNEEPKVASTN
jgi:hypothetical protein